MGNATNETTKKTNWLDAIKAQFKRIIWPTKEEAARRSAVVLAVSVLLGGIWQTGMNIWKTRCGM